MVATLDTPAAPPALSPDAGMGRMMSLLVEFARWLGPRRDKVRLSYIVPERGGFGWYVVGTQPAYDFALSDELSAFASGLIRSGYPIHAVLLPGSVEGSVPTDGIVVTPAGGVTSYAG